MWCSLVCELSSEPPKKCFRADGGGRKAQAPEVRNALFDWFIDARSIFKARIPKPMLKAVAKQLYQNWLDQQEPSIPEDKQLKFGNQ